jgi:hypothetical protein
METVHLKHYDVLIKGDINKKLTLLNKLSQCLIVHYWCPILSKTAKCQQLSFKLHHIKCH